MRTLFFLPDDPALRAALDAELARRPKTKRIQWSSLGENRAKALAEALASAHRKHGFAIVDAPRSPDEIRAIDQACRARFRSLPIGVFFSPPKPRKDGDLYAEYRAAMKETFAHFHPDRRDRLFRKASPKALVAALKLAARSDSIIRWGSLTPMAVLAGAILAAVVFLRDPLLHRGAVRGLEAAFGARAEVGGLSTTFTPSLELRNVKVADRRKPMRNLFEFERLAGGVALGPLLSGRVHVDELAIEGFRPGTERSESGALSQPEASQPLIAPVDPSAVPDPLAPAAPGAKEEPPPTIERALEDIVKRLEIPAPDDLETVRRAREAEKQVRDRAERWRRSGGAEERLAKAKAGIDGLRTAKLSDSTRAAIDDARSFQKELQGLDSAKSDLAVVSAIGFDEEKKKLETAKADIEKARKSLKEAEELSAKTKGVQKSEGTGVLKILSLVNDLRNMLKTLDSAATGLQSATRSVEDAKSGIERKRKMGDEKLGAAEKNIAGARRFLGGPGGTDIAGRVTRAKADLEAQQKELTGRLEGLKGDVEQGRKEMEDLRKAVTEDIRYVSGLPQYMKECVDADRRKVLERFNPENFNAEGLGRALFGRRAATWLHYGLAAYKTLRPLLTGSKDKKPAKVKHEYGTTYHFPQPKKSPPRVWIKKATISGSHTIGGEPFRIDGKAVHLASDLAAVGQEAHVDLTLVAGAKKISIRFRATPQGELDLEVEASGFTVAGRRIENRHAPVDVGDGSLAVRVHADFAPEGVDAGVRMALEGLKLTMAEESEPRYLFLREFLAELAGLAAEIDLRWECDRLAKLDVRSDQMERLNAALRRALGREIAEAKEKAGRKVDEMTSGCLRDTNALAQGFLGSAGAEDRRLGTLLAGTGLGELPDVAKPFGEARKELDFLSDPAAQLKRADDLDGQRGTVAASFSKSAGEQSSSADGVQSMVNGETQRLGIVQGDLKGEIDRLLKLIGR